MSPECCKDPPYIITRMHTATQALRKHMRALGGGGLNCLPSSLKHVWYASINPMLHIKTLLQLHMQPHLEFCFQYTQRDLKDESAYMPDPRSAVDIAVRLWACAPRQPTTT